VTRASREAPGVLDVQEDLEVKTVLPADKIPLHNIPVSEGSHSVPTACDIADCASLMTLLSHLSAPSMMLWVVCLDVCALERRTVYSQPMFQKSLLIL
jgi:hypothetical protein